MQPGPFPNVDFLEGGLRFSFEGDVVHGQFELVGQVVVLRGEAADLRL